MAIIQHDMAVALLKAHDRGDHQGYDYADWVAAGARVYQTSMEHPERNRPFVTDARPQTRKQIVQEMFRDMAQINESFRRRQAARDAGATAASVVSYEKGGQIEAGIHGAQEAAQKVGGTVVQELKGDPSHYLVLGTVNGAVLVYIGTATDIVDPGQINEGSGMTRDRIRRETARDADWSRRQLQQINQRNAAFYGSKAS
jgi:hypothetical protein